MPWIFFHGSYARDGYHINVERIFDYEMELAKYMGAMICDTQQ